MKNSILSTRYKLQNPNDPKNQKENVDENELIEAEAEEAEGKLIQKKQLEKLDDEDFFDMFTPDHGILLF